MRGSCNGSWRASGIHLDLKGSTFEQITNGEQGYAIFTFKESDNASVFGGTLRGDKTTHDYTKLSSAGYNSHEWGFGVSVMV